jgi:hypothetical protein
MSHRNVAKLRTMQQPRARISLRFQPRLDGAAAGKELRDGLSAVLRVGRTLWLANDESATLERLVLQGDEATGHRQFALRDLLDLPEPGSGDQAAPEVDVEGLDEADGWLWVTGSHSLKRCKPDPQEDGARKGHKRLARIEARANRFLLARLPLAEVDGLPAPVARAGERRAQRLPGTARANELTRLLRKDKHLGPFIGLPGKENGFDIEGLAVAGERLFLGLRGPVLRGWATVLELRPRGGAGATLELAPFPQDRKKRRVRKHFLQLQGLGIRDLCLHGEDLLVLAGPTMSLDGPVRVLRWPQAARCDDACMLAAGELQPVLELPYGDGCDHAEGMALLPGEGDGPARLLVVHDQPATERQRGDSTLLADVYDLPAAGPSA